MSVSYTISWQDWVEDGERSDTLYQCPLCGIAYDLNPRYRPHPYHWISPFKYPAQVTFVEVTDDCNCHDDHTPPMTLGLPTWG